MASTISPNKSGTAFRVVFNRAQEKKMLAGYSAEAVDHILKEAARVGGQAAARVMRPAAPIGTAERLSQYYRKMGLGHGTFRKSIRAAPIRGRGGMIKGLQARTVGQVVGPIGRNAFTRAWIEFGTRRGERPNPWLERVAAAVFAVARDASDAVLTLYAREH